MPSHGPQDLAIKLIDSKQLLWGWLYLLKEKELDTLCSYLKVQLKWGHIRPSNSFTRALVLFVSKMDGTLQLGVDSKRLNQIMKNN
jgi:hypothetical protein